jgi:ribonuclease E
MLDNETSESTQTDLNGATAAADTSVGGDVTATPAAKATRKAPAKRVARKATKQAPVAPGADPSNPSPVTESSADPAPAKKAARPRKAAAKKIPDVAVEPLPVVVGEPLADATSAPAKKAARKRASKKVAAPTVAAEVGVAPESSAPSKSTEAQQTLSVGPLPSHAPALAAPAVLFQPPSEATVAPRRRRGATKAVISAEETPIVAVEPAEIASTTVRDETEDQLDAAEAGEAGAGRKRRRRGRRGRGARSADGISESGEDGGADEVDAEAEVSGDEDADHAEEVAEAALSASARRRRRRRRSGGADGADAIAEDDPPNTVVHVRDSKPSGARGGAADEDGVRGVKGSTRLEAKRQRRRDNRDTGRRRAPILTEAEFLARREAVERVMAVRQTGDRTQIAVLEDGVLVEHYVTRASAQSAVGNVYLGRVQNVLPSMEAAFVDIGRGRNGVLYAGEVNWDAAGLEGKARAIENALNPGDAVLVQVTKDPIGHKGARLTSQISLAGRFVVYVPGGGMTGISRKLPDVERTRLKAILKKVVPEDAGVIVRTAAEGASEADLVNDVERLKEQWEAIAKKSANTSDAPTPVHGEPDLAIRVVRDVFNDDFTKLTVAGSDTHATISQYVADIAPDLAERISIYTGEGDLFHDLRVDEQLAKALDRKVWLPSGGSLVIDRTEAMTVVDVNTGKYTGSGGNLEQTVTRNNLEAAEEIVRQLRLRDIGGIVVIDFIDMVLESNRDLVLRRLTECLGRDRTKHQVAEVTSLGLVQMTRKRVGEGLLEAFSEPCEHCKGRGVIVHVEPLDKKLSGSSASVADEERPSRGKRTRKAKAAIATTEPVDQAAEAEKRRIAANAVAAIAAATTHHDVVDQSDASAPAARADEDARHARPDGTDEAFEIPTIGSNADQGSSDSNLASAVGQVDSSVASPNGALPAVAVSAARPRRRRAASRPAGPPAGASTGPAAG